MTAVGRGVAGRQRAGRRCAGGGGAGCAGELGSGGRVGARREP